MASRAPIEPQKSKASPLPKEERIRKQTDEQSLPLEERIRLRAYEIYLECGGQDGSDLDHWLQAEAEFLTELGKEP
ncbi:MAG TPA: DUF2934 domain-containing protein [Bryobacteraceae bacterium]|jgi:hypothetical protein|nr:DUF2934 domain-containing protein [Bryobacteraceae bacterium]